MGLDVSSTGARESGGAVLPEVPYFNKLAFWQEARPDEDCSRNVAVDDTDSDDLDSGRFWFWRAHLFTILRVSYPSDAGGYFDTDFPLTRHCNGGTLENLIYHHHAAAEIVPESFLWYNALPGFH